MWDHKAITSSSMNNKIQKRYNRIAEVYDLLDMPMEAMLKKWRKKMLTETSGKTLEVGIGTGKNIPYYPEHVDLTGIDFSEKMIAKARKKTNTGQKVELKVMNAQNMYFDDNRFDTVVTSCVFCSVPEPVKGLKEIRRVCKPGGRILMLEHVRSNKKPLGKIMDILNPLPLHIYGANINRRTYDNLLLAGFNPNNVRVVNLWHDIVKLIRIVNKK